MSTTVDSLDIQISAQANNATKSLDMLVRRLEKVSSALNKDTTGLGTLSVGVSRLTAAMQGMNNIKTTDFSRLAKNIEKLANLNTSGLNSAASSLSSLSKAFGALGGVSQYVQQIGQLASNISKLGNKSISNAITNLPALASGLNNLMATLSKAPTVSNNIIHMTNALANLASQGRSVGGAAKGLVGNLNGYTASANRASKSTFSLASAFGRFYASYFLIVRGIKKLWGSIESTADYIETFNYYTVAFDKVASEWDENWEKYGYQNAEAYAESFTARMNDTLGKMSGVQINVETGLLEDTGIKNLGLNVEEITQAASNIAAITNSVGQTGEVSLATAQSMTALAGDISSLFNIDYSSVITNLKSGLIGQSRALYKYGIDITNATLQTYAYELGLEKAVSEMTQAEKMQLRLIAILDQSKVSWGDLANTINSPSNMIRQFKNNVSELSTVFGQLFIPILKKWMPIINGVTIALKNLLVSIAGFFGVKINLEDFGQGYTDLEEDLEDVSGAYDDAASAAKKFKTTTLGIDELNINAPQDEADTGTSVGGGSIDLTNEILKASEEYQKVWKEAYAQMENRAQKFAKKIEKVLEPVKKLFSDIAIGDWFAVGQDTSNIVSGIFDFFTRAIAQVDWYTLGNNMGLFLAGINWTEILSSIGRFIWEGINASIDLWKGSFDAAPIETTVVTALGVLSFTGIASSLLAGIKTALSPAAIGEALSGAFAQGGIFSKVTEMFALWTGGAGTFGESFMAVFGVGGVVTVALAALVAGLGIVFTKNEEVRESFFNAIDAIKNGLQPAIEFISDTVLPNLKASLDRIIEILSPFSEFLEGVFTDIWQEMINPALTYIGEVVLPKVTQTFENLWNNVLVPLGSFMADVFEPIIYIVSKAFTFLWKDVVVPLADMVGNVLAAVFEGLCDIFNKTVIPIVGVVIDVFQFLWTKVFEPLVNYLWDRFEPVFENVFGAIKGIIEGLTKTFEGLIHYITGVFTLDWSKAWEGIKDVFKGIFNSFISIAEGVINIIIDGVNNFTSGFRGLITDFGDVIGIDINIPDISKISLPRFELGGFPDKSSLFFAGEYGVPELLGTVGGKTAVAGGAEITGIRQEIRDTANEEILLLREQNSLLRELIAKEMSVNIGDREIARANYRGQKSLGRRLITEY